LNSDARVARAEAPKRALGAFLPDPCPCELAASATQPFHPEANRYMCRSYHTGRGHPACDAVLRHAPVASLDGTLHRHLHALERSPAYLCFSADQKWPRIGSGNFALTELIASSTCRRSAVSLPVFRNCILSRTNSSKPSKIDLHSPLRHNFNMFGEKDELGSQNSVAAHSENGSEPPCRTALPYLKAESKLQA
jgi:hypothetical protein